MASSSSTKSMHRLDSEHLKVFTSWIAKDCKAMTSLQLQKA